MNLHEEIERNRALGYNEQNAEAKLGQDIILKAIADSGMAENATIKGGVVMRSISGNSRRATLDFDLDFIRYSLSDDSIIKFVNKLDCIDNLTIKLNGAIAELNHQDYKGKRIYLSITDKENTVISVKLDIGVHGDLSIDQTEYSFDLGFQEDSVSLLINSPAQMITEKIKSIIRFGSRNTRYKDVFDICYLGDLADAEQLKNCIQKYILDDPTLRNISNIADVINRVERVFINDNYLKELRRSNKNWLDISIEEVLEKDLELLKGIAL